MWKMKKVSFEVSEEEAKCIRKKAWRSGYLTKSGYVKNLLLAKSSLRERFLHWLGVC
ncbi:MAG: hypothetical protein ABIH82_05780 [Candidatus Woesearchaeota archaeon]